MGLKVRLKKWLAMGNTVSAKNPKFKKLGKNRTPAEQQAWLDAQKAKRSGGGKPNSKPSSGRGVSY